MTGNVLRAFGVAIAVAAAFTITTITVTQVAAAEDYPTKPVRMLVPVAPGGPMDMAARLVGEQLSTKWGQTVIVENRPGGGQVIATSAVASAPADGYTLLIMGHVFAMNPWLFNSLPYEPEALTAITQLTETPLILVANNDLPVNSVQELIDYARQNPGAISFGSSGVSSSLRFAGELMKNMAEIDMVHVPYDGNGPMTVAVMAGEVHIGFVNPVSLPYIQEGRVKPLAVTSLQRLESLPDVPTMAEAALEGYEAGSWFGMMAPGGTDPAIIEKINTDVNAVLADPEIVRQLTAVDATPKGRTVSDFAAYIEDETERWGELIRELDMTVQ